MIVFVLLFFFFLCWGSFLNVVAYRLIKGTSFLGRSACIKCDHQIAWYDLIPIISYIALHGKCRHCQQSISLLYPTIELLTAITLTFLYYQIDANYFIGYFLFFSALIVTIRTDLETMLISRWVTLALLPLGFFLSITDRIQIGPINSIMGMAVGYISLWLVNTIFYALTKKHGMGEGDFELLAMIGSFTGLIGVWATILFGSVIGSIVGTLYLYYSGTLRRNAPLAFGPFLAAGALLYILFQDEITLLFTGSLN